MLVLYVVFVTCALLLRCDAAFVDTLPKCSVKDDECLKKLYQNAIQDIKKTGVPELDIPPIDPLQISNFSVTLLGAIKITVLDGVVKGISNCKFKTYHLDFEKGWGSHEILCDLTIKGQVAISGSSPDTQKLLGTTDISGQGKGKVKLEKVDINFDFPLKPYRKENGDVYVKVIIKDTKYTYDIGNANIVAEKIIIGGNDLSQLVMSYFNQNWRSLLKTFGKDFVDKALVYYFDFTSKFFDSIPTKKIIIEDLSPYVKN